MKTKLKRALALLPVTALLVTACGSGGATQTANGTEGTESSGATMTQSGPTDGTISLKIWGAEDDADLLNTICTNFQAEYPDYTFEFTIEACEESNAKDHVLADVANAPDVFTFADDQLSSLVASGLIKAVADPDDVTSRNSEASVSAASINDTLYAYPLTADNGYFLYYNKDYFTDTDLETMDGILAVAAKNDKKVTMDWGSGWYLYSFFGNTGLTVGLNDDGISNYCDWNSTENSIKGVDVLEAMMSIGSNSGFLNGNDDALNAGAKDGSVIAGISGVWDSTTLEEAWGDKLGAVKLPTYTVAGQQIQMSSYAGFKMVGVNSYSENAEWAAKFADYMTNEDNQNLRFESRGQGPSNTNAASSKAVQTSPAIVALIQQSEFASLQRIGSAYWTPVAEFGAMMSSGNLGGLKEQEVMDNLVAEITASDS